MRSWNLIFLSVALLLGASVPVAFSQASLLSRDQFEQMLKHRNEASCPANGFYTYDAFIAAANSFSGFATVGDDTTKKREIAAFLAQTSHETTGGYHFIAATRLKNHSFFIAFLMHVFNLPIRGGKILAGFITIPMLCC